MADLLAYKGRATPKRWRSRLTDALLAACGLMLGLLCFSFPWYVFFHQEEFGVRAMEFGKVDAALNGAGAGASVPLFPDAIDPDLNPNEPGLDTMATGTTPAPAAENKPEPGPEEQPFPAPKVKFRLVMVTNGQAMIEDGASFWVVAKGSLLPDNSEVRAIEQRDGKWVLVTSDNEVVEISE